MAPPGHTEWGIEPGWGPSCSGAQRAFLAPCRLVSERAITWVTNAVFHHGLHPLLPWWVSLQLCHERRNRRYWSVRGLAWKLCELGHTLFGDAQESIGKVGRGWSREGWEKVIWDNVNGTSFECTYWWAAETFYFMQVLQSSSWPSAHCKHP